MPTTSSPWASPSSPAGRRLLQAEPVTADDIPILDEAALALGAALVAAADASPAARPEAAPLRPLVAGRPAAPTARRWHRSIVRRSLSGAVAATLVVGVLVVSATAGLDRPAPAVPTAAAPLALGRAAGEAIDAQDAPVPGGQVVVALIEPTAALAATPGVPAGPPLAARLGSLVALAAEESSAG